MKECECSNETIGDSGVEETFPGVPDTVPQGGDARDRTTRVPVESS